MKQHNVMTPYMVGEVHFYSTEIDGELVLFDTGPPTPEAVSVLETEVDLKRLKHVFITHCHVDHYGLAAHIEATSDARIYFPRKDVLRLRRQDDWLSGMRDLLLATGFDDDFCRKLQVLFTSPGMLPPCPNEYGCVEDSDVPQRLGITVLPCPGHSQSDLVYLQDRYALTGDLLLREIFQSPSLDLDVETFAGRFRNFDAYCDSLINLASLRDRIVLPSHRRDIAGVDQTLLFYLTKLLERAGQVKQHGDLELVSQVVERIFGPTLDNPFVIYIKASEIYFMRDFLADPLRLRTSLERIGLFEPLRELFEAVSG
jgi:2,4-dienoyl-CoA reductase (NADPH2)